MDNIYVASGTAALVSATLLQLVKNSPLVPWINRDTGRLNAFISMIVAGIGAFGVSYTFNFDATTGAFALGFTGTVADVLHGIGRWIVQWSTQHAIYKGLLVPAEAAGEMRAILKEGLLGQAPQVKHEVPNAIERLHDDS